MDNDPAQLIELLESAVGREHIVAHPDMEIDGFRPVLMVEPGCRSEVLECLKTCSRVGAAVVPAGLGGWLECGNPLRRADVVISLSRMNRMIEYSPADLTATAEAGMTIAEFNAAARSERQWLPFDPPGSPGASLGAIIICASSGPLRFGFGTPRDYVIGLKLAHADGTESKSGGRVVKNVAGYDMNKLYVGSFGTLAVVTELTFKLRPLPERSATVVITASQRSSLTGIANQVLTSELQPVSHFLTSGLVRELPGEDRGAGALLVRFMDSEAAVDYQLNRLNSFINPDAESRLLADTDADAMWSRTADVYRVAGNTIRASVPLSKIMAALETLSSLPPEHVTVADLGTGIIQAAFDAEDNRVAELVRLLRDEVQSLGGTLIVEKAPLEVRRQVEVWGDPGAAARIMLEIKNKFDPQSMLSPGRFVAGI